MKFLYIFFLTLSSLKLGAADPITQFAELIGKGNIHELAKSFAPTVEVTLMDATNSYSKAQAELVLNQFFTQNKPLGSKIFHKVNTGSSFVFGVVIITTEKGPYRAAATFKNVDGNMQLIELRVEIEKVK